MADYDIAVDFMEMRNDGRIWVRLADAREGLVPIAGRHVVVGCRDADLGATCSPVSRSTVAAIETRSVVPPAGGLAAAVGEIRRPWKRTRAPIDIEADQGILPGHRCRHRACSGANVALHSRVCRRSR